MPTIHTVKFMATSYRRLSEKQPRNHVAPFECDFIERSITRDHLKRYVSPPAWMPPTQGASPSKLNGHPPPYRRRIDSSDEFEPDRPVLPPRRPHIEFDDGDYKQVEDTEPEPSRRRKRLKFSANPFIAPKPAWTDTPMPTKEPAKRMII